MQFSHLYRVMWHYPFGPPNTSTSSKPFHFLAGDQLMVPIGASHISSWLQEIQSREWEERTKNKRIIWAWVNSKCKKRSYITLHSLCICRLTLACISSENSTTHEECWLILTGLPSLLWTLCHADWSLLLSGVDWPLASPFATCVLWVPSSNSRLAFPSYFRSRRDLESKPFVWFRAKTDKGILCLVDHLHSVTVSYVRLYVSCLNFWDEACWFLSLRVFGLLSSSLLLFPQRFGRYVLRPSSGVWDFNTFYFRCFLSLSNLCDIIHVQKFILNNATYQNHFFKTFKVA